MDHINVYIICSQVFKIFTGNIYDILVVVSNSICLLIK